MLGLAGDLPLSGAAPSVNGRRCWGYSRSPALGPSGRGQPLPPGKSRQQTPSLLTKLATPHRVPGLWGRRKVSAWGHAALGPPSMLTQLCPEEVP